MTPNGPRVECRTRFRISGMARYLHQISSKYRDKGMHFTRVLRVVLGFVMNSINHLSCQDKPGNF
jgi:hypothetical protein